MSERGLLQLVSVSFQPIEQTLALDTLDCSSQMNELPCEILVLMPHISLLRHRGVQISLTSLQLSEHDHEPSGSSGGTHPVSVASGNRDCCFPPPPPLDGVILALGRFPQHVQFSTCHQYSLVGRGTGISKCHAQEYSTTMRSGLQHGPFHPRFPCLGYAQFIHTEAAIAQKNCC